MIEFRQKITLKGVMHWIDPHDSNSALCGNWIIDRTYGGQLPDPQPSIEIQEAGECIYCQARIEAEKSANELLEAIRRGLVHNDPTTKTLSLGAVAAAAIEKANMLTEEGKLARADCSNGGFQRWIGIYISAAHDVLDEA